MKKTILIILIAILITNIAYAIGEDECQDRIVPGDVPCLVLLPSNSDCSTIEINYFDNASLPLKTETMGTFAPFMCNSTFTFSALGLYTFNYTTGDTGSITVTEGNIVELLLYFVGALAILLLVFAVWKNDTNFGMLSGFTFTILGIFIFINGFDTVQNFITEGLGIILMGVGILIIWIAVVESLEQSEQ